MMSHQQLMRVYGALMWSLARILQNPEVTTSHLKSLQRLIGIVLRFAEFMWGASGTNHCNTQATGCTLHVSLITFNKKLFRELFEMEEEDLFNELQALPRFALIRRLNDLIKRAKAVKVRNLCNNGMLL